MEFRLLQYFAILSQELHFTKAAEKLGITQPTLSQQIRLLENSLDTVLFRRMGKKIELTESGEILLEHVKKIFSEIDQAKIKIHELKGLNRGHLKIGCVGNHHLYSSLLTFHSQFPNIKLSVYDLKTEETLEKIVKSELDIGIVYLPVHHPQVEVIKWFSLEFFAIVSLDHPLAEKNLIYLEELQSYPIFLLPEQYVLRQTIDSFCNKEGIKLNPIVELSDTYSLLKMTLLHNGITILPKLYVENSPEFSVKLLKIADELPRKEVAIIYRKGLLSSTAIRTFIQQLTRR
ncbi:MAG: LysR family transcriptional regulator [Bacillaceae bacterium]|jgi:DNA-binding transcriptional LysR family regulator|uniref:LysR family transcriptional regulator n=1 Tax=Aeribacillus sp. FSL K6-1121 TaxID=2954745 RepID=UPI000E3949E3|nr:LysR family transcriptional regulator [Aeribacillus pallidus]REJ13602.1 MAG: LysR family transcriptional regulator [Bacillaceae bacterium]